MTLKEIYKIADELAPKSLSDEGCQTYGYYDNSGILLDIGNDIQAAQFSLDFSDLAIEEAIKNKANLLITHHPAFYGGIGDHITQDTILGRKIIKCIQNGVSVISMHLNLDFTVQGIDESLMKGISRSISKTTGAGTSSTLMRPLSVGGYGRAYYVEKTTLKELKESLQTEFETSRTLSFGNENKEIKKIASFCGGGGDEESVRFAKKENADVIISSDFKHHVIAMALEENLSVISLTHYASEYYGFKKYYKKISQRIEIPCYLSTDKDLL